MVGRRSTPSALLLFFIASCISCASNGRDEAGTCASAALAGTEGVWEVPMGRLPYMISIRRHGAREHVCSGVLINPWWAVTAAHCVDGQSQYGAGTRPIVQIGSNRVDDASQAGVEVSIVEGTVTHPKWACNGNQNSQHNIALLKLTRRSSLAFPTMLTDHFSIHTGQKLIAAGWGFGPEGPRLGGDIFDTLKMEKQALIEGPHCNRSALWDGSMAANTLCGLNQGQKSSCIVDSGCPLMLVDMPGSNVDDGDPALDFLVGINIHGAACGTSAKPDVYLDLRAHSDWIRREIGETPMASEL